MVTSLMSELDELGDVLMTLELRQVEKFDSLIDDFDNRLNEMKNIALELQTTSTYVCACIEYMYIWCACVCACAYKRLCMCACRLYVTYHLT